MKDYNTLKFATDSYLEKIESTNQVAKDILTDRRAFAAECERIDKLERGGFYPCIKCGTETRYRDNRIGHPTCGSCLR